MQLPMLGDGEYGGMAYSSDASSTTSSRRQGFPPASSSTSSGRQGFPPASSSSSGRQGFPPATSSSATPTPTGGTGPTYEICLSTSYSEGGKDTEYYEYTTHSPSKSAQMQCSNPQLTLTCRCLRRQSSPGSSNCALQDMRRGERRSFVHSFRRLQWQVQCQIHQSRNNDTWRKVCDFSPN